MDNASRRDPEPAAPEPTPPGMIPGSAPGMIPGATSPAGPTPWSDQPGSPGSPTVPGQPATLRDRDGYPVTEPKGQAAALIGVAIAYTVLSLALAAFARSDLESLKEGFGGGTITPTAGMFLQFLSPVLLLGSYLAYGMWASRIRRNVEAAGRPAGGPPAVEWWGWFVPIASVVLVPWGARAISRGSAPLGVLLGWWVTWTLAQLASGVSGVITFFAIDQRTGDITNEALLDTTPTWAWVSAVLVVVSLAFLVTFVRGTTTRHLEPRAA